MSEDQRGKVTRIGNADQGWDWHAEWQTGWSPRPANGIPIFGIFLILFGLFLVFNEFVAVTRVAVSAFFLVLGLALLAQWLRDRGHLSLYFGAIITALSLADLLTAFGVVHGDGWGTFLLGIAFLAIAAIRASGGAGLGWQAVLGIVLFLGGGTQVASFYGAPDIGRFAVPLLIVLLGLWIVTRQRSARIR